MGADGSSDPDADSDADAEEQDDGETDKAEGNDIEDTAAEVAEVAAEAATAVGDKTDAMPAEISLERPGTKLPVTIPTSAMGKLPIHTRRMCKYKLSCQGFSCTDA